MDQVDSALRRSRKIMALIPLAVLSVAWTASIATTGAGSALADATTDTRTSRTAPASRPRRSRRPRASPRPAASPPASPATPNSRRHRLDLRHPGRRARGLPARRDRHQLRRPQLPPLVAAGRGDRPGRVRPRPHQRQQPRRPGRRPPGIFGPPLNGADGTSRIADTDAGQYDADSTWDRAVGPMQFIPSTWSVVGVDADGDGQRNPQDIDDAALATAVYLCSGDDDLGKRAGQRAAVLRYNHSQSYVDLVLSIMAAYLDGEFTSVPNGVTSAGYVVPPLRGRPRQQAAPRATRATTAGRPTAAAARGARADKPTSKPTRSRPSSRAADPHRPDRRPKLPVPTLTLPPLPSTSIKPGRPAAHPGPGPGAVPARRLHRQHPEERRPVRPVRVRLHPLIRRLCRGGGQRHLETALGG